MKKLALFTLLSLFSFAASAQSFSQSTYPVFERVYEPSSQVCREVVVDSGYNTGGAVAGAVIGYVLGREIDRDSRSYGGYVGGRGYDRYRGGYSNDRHGYYRGGYDSRVGRYSGTVAGAVIGGQAGRSAGVTTVCDSQSNGYYREVLVGHRIVIRYSNGTTRERFEPVH